MDPLQSPALVAQERQQGGIGSHTKRPSAKGCSGRARPQNSALSAFTIAGLSCLRKIAL
jgi:hypothetical protein